VNPDTKAITEYPVMPGVAPYAAPFPMPYTLSLDEKNQIVWTTDFNSSRLYTLDMKSGKSTEFFTPAPYEVRDLTVDRTAERPTVWIPAYRPPAKMVKVQMR
jgi:hypothetical protein